MKISAYFYKLEQENAVYNAQNLNGMYMNFIDQMRCPSPNVK